MLKPIYRKALQEILWVSCLMWGILLMITGATEGFPYTSIHIRGDLAQDIVGFIGLILAMFGTYYGFALGKMKKRDIGEALRAEIKSDDRRSALRSSQSEVGPTSKSPRSD